jgi:hypothetical protein
MSKIKCAVCGKEKTEHGDGMKYPKTTCTYCYKLRIEKNKLRKSIDKGLKQDKKEQVIELTNNITMVKGDHNIETVAQLVCNRLNRKKAQQGACNG